MEKKELTYILGAGASFQSIPIVKTFSSRFNDFLLWIDRDIIKDNGFSADVKQKFGILYELGNDLHKSFESHQSFDTYFKKLFHTGQKDKISEGKKVLNLYFIWEHLSLPVVKPEKYDEYAFWKESSIDKRYDALIAGLLRPIPDQKEPYCKVNFITWNYDLNLLMSLKNYFSPNATITDFFNQINKNNGLWQVEEKITVINMNGFFYCSYFNDLESLQRRNIHDIIYSKIKNQNYFDSLITNNLHEYTANNVDTDAELIKFAWEKSELSHLIAKDKIDESKNIVIIGYTFPLYNRLVDLSYLEQSVISNRSIFVQDPKADTIRQNLLDYYQLNDNDSLERSLKAVKDCDSFYIPSDIFGVKDSTGNYYFV